MANTKANIRNYRPTLELFGGGVCAAIIYYYWHNRVNGCRHDTVFDWFFDQIYYFDSNLARLQQIFDICQYFAKKKPNWEKISTINFRRHSTHFRNQSIPHQKLSNWVRICSNNGIELINYLLLVVAHKVASQTNKQSIFIFPNFLSLFKSKATNTFTPLHLLINDLHLFTSI